MAVSDTPEVKEWAVENRNTLGTVRIIECYRHSTAQAIADSGNIEFKKQGSPTVSLVVRL